MNDIIHLGNLECYINAKNKDHPLMAPNRGFDLGKINNKEIREELREFILYRGTVLSPLSIRSDIYPFNQLCIMLNDIYPNLATFKGFDFENEKKQCKAWLLKNGKKISQQYTRTSTGKKEITDAEVVNYLRKVVGYFNKVEEIFCYESDVWYLKKFPLNLRANPTKRVKSINFKSIRQEQIRKEVKDIIFFNLSRLSVGTVSNELTAVKRFSAFLFERYPDVISLYDLNREIIENYLIYTSTEAKGRKSYVKDLYHLKSVMNTAAEVFEEDSFLFLFNEKEFERAPQYLYKAYSSNELKRLNKGIAELDEQIRRVLVLQQKMGTRISDTLSIKQNAISYNKEGNWVIRITQIKTRYTYNVTIDEMGKKIFDKACEYTNKRFGIQEYVFVDEKNPLEPMQYGRIQYQIMKMITKNHLMDDKGEPFGVGTHIFRHCFGKALTENDVEDVIIAKLLGHKTTRNLTHYRKNGDKRLEKATRKYREDMDEIINRIVSDWKN